ncbi:unnamed protein product [Acanthoscelides obtectus]|uniref:C2H2-type domain-containing protein n=1 Tax=Acanthoscelides obtectus TaxID=200917 RepID=A0A9P0LEM5_ACAOB|nr:unnamed protein product [Acanthoscelides obtectus]CAK1620015.1 hypothetical protein AOBTE_LOCUS135 [Acanthoscelides obtectus]
MLSENVTHSQGEHSHKSSTCIHCNATFRGNRNLDNHIIKKHPEFLATVSRKIFECTHCTYKTVVKNTLDRHVLKHSEGELNHSTCIHCTARFKSNRSLDDHIVRKHPDFLSSVSIKIHECTHCIYKTTFKSNLVSHMLKHTEGELNLTSVSNG